MPVLHLNLKAEYFDAIASGEKCEEYRLATAYWARRLQGRQFDGIVLKKGYPKREDASRTLARPWAGFSIKTITHPHFGQAPVQVFAITVN
ncbi:MAG: ASCH domain-containing protein [Burkholderiales bacterium]|nr:MAG: ASCH domain-containing protein [Burkholderiales bacterium]